eukprot:scaffold16691_cov74-Phaeocystis_antarctica.AAC.4
MELDLALAARRAVASISITTTQWLPLKAAISMTTSHQLGSACIFELSLNFHLSPLERYACSWLAGRGTRHHGHGNVDQHQRVRESGSQGVLAF